MKKAIISTVLAISMALSTNVAAFASTSAKTEPASVHIMLVNTDDASAAINFYGNRAECSSIIDGKDGTTKITATALLKQVNGDRTDTIKTWSNIVSYGESLYFDQSYYVTSGHAYEFEIDAQVYRNGRAENIRVTDSKYCRG